MKYKIIGADGKTYGPLPAQQVRTWLAEGRLEARTPIFAEGAADWTFIRLLPEFAENVSGTPPVIGALKPGVHQTTQTNGFAIAGFAFGVLSLLGCCCCPFNLLGLAFSIIALVQIRSQPQQAGRELALAGLICSGASLLLGLGLGLLQFLFNPALLTWSTHFQ